MTNYKIILIVLLWGIGTISVFGQKLENFEPLPNKSESSKSDKVIYTSGCHQLGSSSTGSLDIGYEIEISQGATLMVEASSNIRFRKNITINGGTLLVKAPLVVFNDDASTIIPNIDVNSVGQLKVYASQKIYLMANMKNNHAIVHFESRNIEIMPHYAATSIDGDNQALFVFLFCDNMTMWFNANLNLKNASNAFFKSPRTQASVFSTSSTWTLENSYAELTTGLLDDKGVWLLTNSKVFNTMYRKLMKGYKNASTGSHDKSLIDMGTSSYGKVWYHHQTVSQDEPCTMANPVLSCTQFASSEVERQFLEKEKNMSVGEKEAASIEDIQIYPNPSTDLVNIAFRLEEAGDVKVEILDAVGKKVWEYEAKKQEIGTQKITWQGKNAERGLYFVHILANGKKEVRKVMLVK